MATTIDTNVLVRVFAKDDSDQWLTAASIVSRPDVVILSTVLLETEWVLRKTIGFDRSIIAGMFRNLLVSETIAFEERERVEQTLAAFEAGMDFADAFHVCGAGKGSTFVSFDRDLVKLATRHIKHVSVELAQ
jgi:predicted nucleic-acid-binding protein